MTATKIMALLAKAPDERGECERCRCTSLSLWADPFDETGAHVSWCCRCWEDRARYILQQLGDTRRDNDRRLLT